MLHKLKQRHLLVGHHQVLQVQFRTRTLSKTGGGRLSSQSHSYTTPRDTAILDATQEEVEKIYRINVQGVIWGIQAAANIFKETGKKGKIINACSIAGHEGFPLLGIYSSTKFAVRALTQSAAKELAAFGITVNSYCPGIVGTDMWVEIDKRMSEITGAELGATYKKYVEGIALGRVETADDVAGFVAFLSSKDSDYITGQSILIDGGLVYR